MIVRNNSARLIILNGGAHDTVKGKDGQVLKVVKPERFKVMPGGGECELPDDFPKSGFFRSLVEKGQLVVIEGAKEEAEELMVPDVELEALEALREEAESLGVEVDKRWKAARLQKEIDAVLGE